MLTGILSSSSHAGLSRGLAPALLRVLPACSTASRTYHHQHESVSNQTPCSVGLMFQPACLELGAWQQALESQGQNAEVLRYRTEFPDTLFGHLAGLLQSRPFPVAVDMSCALPGAAGAELACRGFQVAQAVPPSCHGSSSHWQRLPAGCSDLVTCLPGPCSPPSSELLAEARRLMGKGSYLAVAWNDRDLRSPFVTELESLLEDVNPEYCRASKQHNPPAWTSALADGGALRLTSFTCHPHGLSMPNCGTLQHLLCGLTCVRAHLAASSATRKRFLQEVHQLVSRHFGEAKPFELPLVSKLYLLRHNSSSSAADGPGIRADDESDGLKHHVRRH